MINFGAAKINYNTPLFDVVAQRIRQSARTPDTGYAGHVAQVRVAIRSEVEHCIRLWGCGGRAAEVLQQSRVWPSDVTQITEEAAGDSGLDLSFGLGKESTELNTGRTRSSSVRRIK